jgi:hypothetical protein
VLKRGYGTGAWGWMTAYRETVAIGAVISGQ